MATLKGNIVRQYSDLDLNFTIHPVRKDVNRYLGDLAVINSVKNLILTNRYERLFQPDIGSNVRALLFENMDIITATALEQEIDLVLKNYEPRVRIVKIVVVPEYDKNAYKILLQFNIMNRIEPITITFYLERIR